jgi:class 3 adenylate cyclase
MAAAHGGQVVFTEPTRALLDESVRLRDLGEHVLRDIPASTGSTSWRRRLAG